MMELVDDPQPAIQKRPNGTIPLVSSATRRYESDGSFHEAFAGLTLTIRPSTAVAFMGPNGCGKSTLLQVLLGLQQLDEGEVGLKLQERDLLGAVLQDYRSQLLPWASVKVNLLLPFGGEFDKGIDEEAVLAAAGDFLEKLGYDIPLTKPVKHLSGGQQQSVVLARALAMRPTFFVWDEPTSAIDFARRNILYRLLRESWQQSGASVILVTHDLDEALILADRIVVFSERMQILYDNPVAREGAGHNARFLDTAVAQRIRMDIYTAMRKNGR